jgi:flagellar basal-body rod protein FlgB
MNAIQRHVEVYSQALNLRAQRHQILASNIANADTPNYKARDFDFSSAMQQALGGGEFDLNLARTARGHLTGNGGGTGTHLQYRTETQSAVDGNTVNMDVERNQIADNAIQYQILTQLIGDKFKGLRTAMSGTQG